MAIGSGWVGSSAVATTGQRWMSAAGSAVKVGTPFWMSGLVGKSTADFTITTGRSTYDARVQVTNMQWVVVSTNYTGFATATGSIQNVLSNVITVRPTGSLSGSLFGCEIRHFYQPSGYQNLYLGLVNGPAQNFSLSLNGTVLSFVNYMYLNGVRSYYALTAKNWFFNQVGATFTVSRV